MGSASRYGLVLQDDQVTDDVLFPRLELDQAARTRTATIMGDWFFGATAVTPVQIPFSWLSTPAQWRSDNPITSAAVAVTGGATAYASTPVSQVEFGDNQYAATLDTAVQQDATSLAAHAMFYYATNPASVPRRRFVRLVFILNARTQVEQWRILQVQRGDRITITGAPATWPASVTAQVVDGVAHGIGDNERRVAWLTSPVIGEVDGASGPFFRLDSSLLGGADKTPF